MIHRRDRLDDIAVAETAAERNAALSVHVTHAAAQREIGRREIFESAFADVPLGADVNRTIRLIDDAVEQSGLRGGIRSGGDGRLELVRNGQHVWRRNGEERL